ncbi:MAG TPA: endonuclease MutS2, partial [Acidobacteriota bacterium]|nr:endonuclease MutS2 [Acidobacteriota bacterium]
MDERTFETLELNALLELAARHVQTPFGKACMMRLRPSACSQEITRELELTGECVSFLDMKGRFGLAGLDDPEPILARLRIEGARLEPLQILALERLLLTGTTVRNSIKNLEYAERFPHLIRLASAMPDMKPLLMELQGKILPGGEIDDNASPELKAVRKEKAERRRRIYRTLEALIHGTPHAIQEEIITFRNGRFVIPIRTDSRNRIPGVMHGLSSSGQTTYVEPMNVINQNNDLVR